MKSLRLLLAAAAALWIAAPIAHATAPATVAPDAPAAAHPKAAAAETTGHYLTGRELALRTFPAAPKLNSDADHLDLLITLAVQNSRNEAQTAEAWADQHYTAALLALNHIADPAFETHHPADSAVARLIERASTDGGLVNNQIKDRNARPRPFVQHPGLVLPLFTVTNSSYPSGHSSGAVLRAELLSELFPSHAAELQAKAKLIAASRVVAGVHYESDIEAGQKLGALLFRILKANPRFQQDLEAAKAELRASAATPIPAK